MNGVACAIRTRRADPRCGQTNIAADRWQKPEDERHEFLGSGAINPVLGNEIGDRTVSEELYGRHPELVNIFAACAHKYAGQTKGPF